MNYAAGLIILIGVLLYLHYSYAPRKTTPAMTRQTPRQVSTNLSRTGAVAISGSLLLLLLLILRFAPRFAPAAMPVIVASSMWAAIDSDRIGLRNYKTRIALSPRLLFNLMCLLWPVLFPWYLIVCSKIGDGTLPKR